jgi:acyl carrier protein
MDVKLDAKELDLKQKEELALKLIKIVAEKLNIDEKNVTAASRFQEDLGADSLDIVELLMEIEEEFGVNISDDESERFKTVGDAIAFISTKL